MNTVPCWPRRGLLAGLLTAPLAAPAVGWTAEADGAHRRNWPASQATPPLKLPVWEGTPFDLAQARGQVVLLNFWASWCEPCRSEMPSLELLAQRHAGDGVQVLAVNFRDTDRAIQRFVQDTALSLPVLRDQDGLASRAFGVRIWPTTVLIARNGRAQFSVIGELDWTGLQARQWLAPLIAARP